MHFSCLFSDDDVVQGTCSAVDYIACDVHDDDDDGSDHESPITPTAYLSMPTKDTSQETTKPRLFQRHIANKKR